MQCILLQLLAFNLQTFLHLLWDVCLSFLDCYLHYPSTSHQGSRCCEQQGAFQSSRSISAGKGLPNNLACSSSAPPGIPGPPSSSQRHSSPSNDTSDHTKLGDRQQQSGELRKCGNSGDAVPGRKDKMNHSYQGKDTDRPKEGVATKPKTKVGRT